MQIQINCFVEAPNDDHHLHNNYSLANHQDLQLTLV